MDILDTYKIDLLDSQIQGKCFEYEIKDSFFAAIDGLVQRGNIHTHVECVSVGTIFKFNIQSAGTVIVPCDRCLADLELRIETADVLNVKLGDDYSDEGDCVVVPEAEGYIDLAQYIYEFIALSMPITCCHEPGKCDYEMMQELSKHQSTRSGQEDDESGDSNIDSVESYEEKGSSAEDKPIDPRWSALKDLLN